MLLDYLALLMIFVSIVAIFYIFIYIHELPYEAAKHRNHPQQDAIYVACWLSLFTLHALWPLIFIWALTHREESKESGKSGSRQQLLDRLQQLEGRLARIEAGGAQKQGKGGRA